jgi:hypothetical protein
MAFAIASVNFGPTVLSRSVKSSKIAAAAWADRERISADPSLSWSASLVVVLVG